MNELQSHHDPDKSLRQHVGEVHIAAESLWNEHSDRLRTAFPGLESWWQWSVKLHDVGKASRAFQEYIANPKKYRGRRMSKAHTPLSLLFALVFGRLQQWDWKHRLAVAVAAAGHHSEFKTRQGLSAVLATTEIGDILATQLADLDWAGLRRAIGDDVRPIAPGPDVCDDALLELEDELLDNRLDANSLDDALQYRLLCQFTLSILLEADKAFLAVHADARGRYLSPPHPDISPDRVDAYLATKAGSPMDGIRGAARQALLAGMARHTDRRMQTMTLPTGSGKTMLAATWALTLRQQLGRGNHVPKVIVVLPFLSIIDQTQQEYERLLGDCVAVLTYHSLSERRGDDTEDPDTAEFFIDTWSSDFILTTFDQFLFALMDPRARYQMRFHRLCDALIVMDEIQALPCRLWDILSQLTAALTSFTNTRLLAMSATQPGFLTDAGEIIDQPQRLFALGRYRLELRHRDAMPLDDFVADVLDRLPEWSNLRVLIVLNTRASARAVRDAVERAGVPSLYFLSADVTPRERLAQMDEIKQREKQQAPCIVVATQCIEAGVDLDMQLVIRDFAPLDSIVQVAGRCNRHQLRPRETVRVVSLTNEHGRSFANMIYDPPLLQETRTVLGADRTEVDEEDVFELTRQYFGLLREKRNTGTDVSEKFARWQEGDDVGELLRGRRSQQVSFLVVEQDPQLPAELERLMSIDDRWDRRRELRRLSARIARVTVSVYARRELDPGRFADRDATGSFWLLHPGFYTSRRGLDLQLPSAESWGMIL